MKNKFREDLQKVKVFSVSFEAFPANLINFAKC